MRYRLPDECLPTPAASEIKTGKIKYTRTKRILRGRVRVIAEKTTLFKYSSS